MPPPLPPWCDAHIHLSGLPNSANNPSPPLAAAAIQSIREADWPLVAAAARAHPKIYTPCFGVHPWAAAEVPDPQALAKRLAAALQQVPNACVGEIGLDGALQGPPAAAQNAVFLAQWNAARQAHRPVSLHGFRAWNRIFAIIRQSPNPAGVILHAYSGPHFALTLFAEQPVWFSFGRALLHPNARKIAALAQTAAPHQLLVESDAEYAKNAADAARVGERLAALRGETPARFAQTITANYSRAFFP